MDSIIWLINMSFMIVHDSTFIDLYATQRLFSALYHCSFKRTSTEVHQNMVPATCKPSASICTVSHILFQIRTFTVSFIIVIRCIRCRYHHFVQSWDAKKVISALASCICSAMQEHAVAKK